MKLIKIVLVPLIALVVNGCTGMKNDSDCTATDGIAGCASMTEVNQMTNQGLISSDEEGRTYRHYNSKESDPKSEFSLPTRSIQAVNAPLPNIAPIRVPERTALMVIFPFIDVDNNYHDTSNINLLLTPSRWSSPAVRDIRTQGEADYEY